MPQAQNDGIKWQDDLLTGFQTLDEQHLDLVNRVNEFVSETLHHRGHRSMKEFIHFLDNYVNRHFATEEAYMAAFHYPKQDEHKLAHAEFAKELNELKHYSFGAESLVSPITLAARMHRWFIDHMAKYDRELITFLKTKH